ncbi:MAG: hypothetical protein J6M20_05300 [Clostridia bacterium]|nr:hypothetical protein [Clostridia bacterium]
MSITTTTSTTTSTSSSTTTSSSSIYEELEDIKAAYQDAIGRPMPQSIASYVQQEIIMGHMDAHDIQYALAETAMAPRPSWRYAMAIISRLQRELPWEKKTEDGRYR